MDLHDEKNCMIYNIKPEHAVRFVLTDDKAVSIKLLDGIAEIFGTELVKDKLYTFLSPSSISVFSWQGCSVKFYGTARKIFYENQPSMFFSAYIHACLEERRITAVNENTRGPISMVIGARDVGKSSFCRILLNYAASQGRCPLYVDLNVDQSSTSLPGTINMLVVEKPGDVIEGFTHNASSVYSFGYITPTSNLPLYLLMVKELGKKVQNLFKNANHSTYFSGVVIDTYGWVTSDGYAATEVAASAFDVDIVFVINNKQLCFKLKEYLPSRVEIVLVPIAETRERRKIFRSKSRDNCIFDYFYGLKNPLNPHRFNIKFNEIDIYKILPATKLSDLKDVSLGDISIVKVPFGKDLMYHILSLSYSDTADESLIKTNIVGFVCVTDICLDDKFITLLSPQPYPLPGRILIMGNVILK